MISELVASLLIEAGVLRKENGVHSDSYLPKDLSSDPNSILDDHLAVIKYNGEDFPYSVRTQPY